MKYLIGNCVINAEHIVKAVYFPENSGVASPNRTACGIATDDVKEDEWSEWLVKGEWSEWLVNEEADAFWKVYSGDAIDVMEVRDELPRVS